MNNLRNSIIVASCLVLSGCNHLNGLIKPKEEKPTTVCNKVVAPIETPLHTFTFFPVPVGTKDSSGVVLVAGVTADGMSSILQNMTQLKKREENWRGRAKAINDCLEQEAKDRAKLTK